MTGTGPVELIGRATEHDTLDGVAVAVRGGKGRVLLVRGDPGVGKSALFDALGARWPGIPTARVDGIEAEADLPFAAIQRLTAAEVFNGATAPTPQAQALDVAIGRVAGPPPNRFLVGLALVSLIGQAARGRGLLLLVDDLPWLDQESIDALAFAARRLEDQPVGVVLARRRDDPVPAFDSFPAMELGGLDADHAHQLLAQVVSRPLQPHIASRIVTTTGGNPLAIIDLAQEMSTRQLVGLTLLPEPVPVGSHLEAHYLSRTATLPPAARLWLLVAAAETTGAPGTVAAAAAVLGIEAAAADLAESTGLVRLGRRIEFRHPLVRSAIYGGATGPNRRRVHNALGAVTRRAADVDRRAWHLAAGCAGPDESVAALLEEAAERARERGGYAARAAFLTRAVELSADGPTRGPRTLRAAEAALMAGRADQALALLDDLEDDLGGPERGRALMIRAGALGFTGAPGAMAEVSAICVRAAEAFGRSSPAEARDALLLAFERAIGAEWMTAGTSPRQIAATARRLGVTAGDGLPETVLRALAALATEPFPDAWPDIRAGIARLGAPDAPPDEVMRLSLVSVALTTAAWDDAARHAILIRAADVARAADALQVLDSLLFVLSVTETVMGQLPSAAEYLAEQRGVRDALGMSPAQQEMFRNIEYLAWCGSADLAASIASAGQAATHLGLGAAETLARTAAMLADIVAGEYDRAYAVARRNRDLAFLQISIRVLPDLVETAYRSGHLEEAATALAELREIATTAGTAWGLGVLARSAAIVAERVDPEPEYRQAIDLLGGTRARGDLARTYLAYGEWLRRHRRRRDARAALRSALGLFDEMGAASFAARARRELAATGSAGPPAESDLTPQESEVVDLAARGATNAEIAAALLISRHTVDYHLRKAFRKLGVSSRRELAAARARSGAS